jgi:cell division protein FtsX
MPRRPVLIAAVAVLVLATGGVLATVWYRHVHANPATPAAHRGYAVSVFLDLDATDADKRAIEAALPDLHPVGGIQFENHQQAWQRFQEEFKDSPDLLKSTKPENLPESYRLTVADLAPVCPAVHRIRKLSGVDEVITVDLALRSPSIGPGPRQHPSDC